MSRAPALWEVLSPKRVLGTGAPVRLATRQDEVWDPRPCPTWWFGGPIEAFDLRCCRSTSAMLRVARFRGLTRRCHSSSRTAAVFSQCTWQSLCDSGSSPQPTVGGPQCSVVSSLRTGPVTGWFLHGIAMDYRDGDIASPRGRTPVEKETAPAFTEAVQPSHGRHSARSVGRLHGLRATVAYRDKDRNP